jgi:hypothetical protein
VTVVDIKSLEGCQRWHNAMSKILDNKDDGGSVDKQTDKYGYS